MRSTPLTGHKKAGPKARLLKGRVSRDGDLLDLLVQRVALEKGIVLLLLDALGDGFLVPLRKVTGDGFALFLGLGAFQGDGFVHGF
jgi:hypothetical protein